MEAFIIKNGGVYLTKDGCYTDNINNAQTYLSFDECESACVSPEKVVVVRLRIEEI